MFIRIYAVIFAGLFFAAIIFQRNYRKSYTQEFENEIVQDRSHSTFFDIEDFKAYSYKNDLLSKSFTGKKGVYLNNKNFIFSGNLTYTEFSPAQDVTLLFESQEATGEMLMTQWGDSAFDSLGKLNTLHFDKPVKVTFDNSNTLVGQNMTAFLNTGEIHMGGPIQGVVHPTPFKPKL